jgi:hypothetical protein
VAVEPVKQVELSEQAMVEMELSLQLLDLLFTMLVAVAQTRLFKALEV